MIKQLQKGYYRLSGTKGNHKLLVLDGVSYVWILANKIGQVLVASQKSHNPAYTMAEGQYRLYTVADEPELIDLEHLELEVADGLWQGYLLPTGLPTKDDVRNRIIPTEEVISRS